MRVRARSWWLRFLSPPADIVNHHAGEKGKPLFCSAVPTVCLSSVCAAFPSPLMRCTHVVLQVHTTSEPFKAFMASLEGNAIEWAEAMTVTTYLVSVAK